MSRYRDAHASTKGPGDARPTALQIVKDEDLIGRLEGKVVIVTGATQGIGLETARAMHATGATVYIAVRNVEAGEKVAAEIASDGGAPVHVIAADLDSLESVRKAAEDFKEQSDRLNVLINNAGIMATPEGKTKDGFELQFGTNHLGHFLLFQLLKPLLLASATPEHASRVISVSSYGHRCGPIRPQDSYEFKSEPYNPWAAYGQAKTANIYFATELDRRYGSKGLHAVSLHPGGIASNLQQHVPAEQMAAFAKDEKVAKYMKSTEQGAATSVYAAISKEWEGKGGRYLSDCVEADKYKGPVDQPLITGDDGYGVWAYDEKLEKQLWADSCRMVGVEDDA